MHAVRVARRRAADRLVGVPARARDDRRRAGDLRALQRRRAASGLRTKYARTASTPARPPVLDRGRRPGPERARRAPARGRVAARGRVGPSSASARRTPRAPAPGEVARPELDRPGAAPVQPDEVERARAEQRASAQPAAGDPAAARARLRARSPGTRAARTAATRSGLIGGRPGFEGARRLPRPQGKPASPDRIFTTVKGPFCGHFSPRWPWPSPFRRSPSPPPRAAARARDPLRHRGQPGHVELPRPPARPGARTDGYDAAVIVLDTPGGLSESMRDDRQEGARLEDPGDRLRLADGARAASAGVWITEAADVARDGAADQHRLLDADRLERRRTSAPTCGGR